MKQPGIVIIGAGQAAAVAAHALREHGYQGCITMLGRERHKPYERPHLSKAVLVAAEEPALQVLAEDAWTRCNIEFAGGIDVIALDLEKRQVRLSDGRVLDYDKCLLATGGEARVHDSLPRSLRGVHYLRTLDDARRLREVLRHKPRVAIMGGGFLGLEVAHSALSAGASVTVVEQAACLLDRFLTAEASAHVLSGLRAAGAQVLLGSSVSTICTPPDGPIQLKTDTGLALDADEVVVAIGLQPNDALARDAGLDIAQGGGVWIDTACRTSDEHVFACGDCTSQLRPGQARPTRLESWQNANEQARMAAAAMLAEPPPAAPVPWFWTDQGSLNIQILGHPAPGLEYVRRGNPAAGKALWIGHRHSVPVHGVAFNAGADLRAIRPLFEKGIPVSLEEFSSDAVNLRTWAKQMQSQAAVAL
ncbi:NAD(P)/FAD-dependent oxidoreductase [Noviherbaspirillum galbum]|uniref:FAD-dependent oxidoreductase n=1 Tax=Noviherbaspirillum galbum TaxID=2709383 RepID=A0A6B3SVM5_9BURK|nr:FAD-dependent oxidoreductase [Noviherbaspirillum galbum]NEX64694.1 FAD-dependent oxidoreductase [Noviherbaspirillum galbum]